MIACTWESPRRTGWPAQDSDEQHGGNGEAHRRQRGAEADIDHALHVVVEPGAERGQALGGEDEERHEQGGDLDGQAKLVHPRVDDEGDALGEVADQAEGAQEEERVIPPGRAGARVTGEARAGVRLAHEVVAVLLGLDPEEQEIQKARQRDQKHLVGDPGRRGHDHGQVEANGGEHEDHREEGGRALPGCIAARRSAGPPSSMARPMRPLTMIMSVA